MRIDATFEKVSVEADGTIALVFKVNGEARSQEALEMVENIGHPVVLDVERQEEHEDRN